MLLLKKDGLPPLSPKILLLMQETCHGCLMPLQVMFLHQQPISMQLFKCSPVSMMERDFYLGRILNGRVSSGTIRIGDRVHGLRHKDSGVEKIEEGKVVKLMKKKGTHMVVIECAGAGDIVSMAGLTSRPSIGHTVASVETMTALPTVVLDPPTISMTFGVNDSPLAGRDGTHCMGKARVRETGASSLRSTTRQASPDGGSGNPKRSACGPRSSSGSRDCSPFIGPGR